MNMLWLKLYVVGWLLWGLGGVGLPSARAAHPELIAESIKEIHVLSPDWICIVVDPTAETLAVRHALYGEAFEKDLDDYRNRRGNSAWYFEKSATYRSLMAIRNFQHPLFVQMQARSFWRVNGQTPAEVSVWAHSVDGMPAISADDRPTQGVYSQLPRLAHMVYLKLDEPLVNGATVQVNSADGRSFSLAYNDDQTKIWSIKVNQSAYDLGAVEKIAYLGMWIPGVGPADFAALEGQPFHLRRVVAGALAAEAEFEGVIRLRRLARDQEVRREGGANLTGEDVYELDFSEFQQEGTFAIHIPGLGRSWPFQITSDGYAEAFYTLMKGLFIQRSGVALERPHTAWERPACFTETRPGNFIAESEPWYLQRYRTDDQPPRFGFRDEEGRQIRLSQFTLVGNSPRDVDPIPGLWGGWHDAADYDRRYHHYNIVWDLLALAETRSGQFPDGQLNMPQSGNGIPDLLDEAWWGVAVWARSQRADGAVSSWIEQESHPNAGHTLESAFVESDREMPFFVSIPDRTGSFAYAASAAWLGRLLQPYHPQRAAALLQSAERAFAWAQSESSVMRNLSFKIDRPMRDRQLEGQVIRFDEDPEMRPTDNAFVQCAFAAANLYLATGKQAYLDVWLEMDATEHLSRQGHRINPSQLVPLLTNKVLPAADTNRLRQMLLTQTETFLEAQANHPYRMYWYAPDAGWFHTMGWGNIYQRTRHLSVAYLLTGEDHYRTALQHAGNFFLGANPQGTSMITGIGSIFPVVLQHIHSKNDGIAEPTPGIPLFWLTFGVNMTPFYLADNGHPSVNNFYEPTALAFIPAQWGLEEIQRSLDAAEKSGNWVRELSGPLRDTVWANFPVLRRRAIHPTHVVDQNEFTVYETIAPLALLYGALTAEDWMPSPEIRYREPIREIDQLPYYPLP